MKTYHYARNAAHQTTAPDPEFGVAEQWAAAILAAGDDEDRTVATAYGATADEAVMNACAIAEAMNAPHREMAATITKCNRFAWWSERDQPSADDMRRRLTRILQETRKTRRAMQDA